ncbi:hypothetical protein LBMAG42_27780 [Deltaproteobacteria bacterium]|nr:hypothetical protein LBMAG42_27780 [Deltaproteobacteria bacterium]
MLESQAAGWEDDEWFDMLVALHAAAGRVRRAANLDDGGIRGPEGSPPIVHEETLDFLVGLTLFAGGLESWVEGIAAAGARLEVSPHAQPPEAGPPERLLR